MTLNIIVVRHIVILAVGGMMISVVVHINMEMTNMVCGNGVEILDFVA